MTEIVKLKFNELSTGQIVDNEYSDMGVTISSGDGDNPVMVFDTNQPTGGDTDLATNNLDNVLILSEDGDSTDPDDEANGGTFIFDFETPAEIEKLTLLDVEEGASIKLYDDEGDLIDEIFVTTADNGQCVVKIGEKDVSKMVVELNGSGALDNVEYKIDLDDHDDDDDDDDDDDTALNGLVEGSNSGDIIDINYTGDPQGDMIDNGDAILAGEGPQDDIVLAFGGDDLVEAGEGDDEVYGGDGEDELYGENGNDIIFGGNGPGADDNLVENGSFEDTTGMTQTGYGYVDTGSIPNWTETDPSASIDVHNNGRGGIEATDGNNWLDLEASPGDNRIGQDVSGIEDGQSYVLTFDAGDGASGGPASENLVNVYWGGELVATIDPPQGETSNYQFALIGGAGDGSDRLEFEGVGPDDNVGASIDSVRIFSSDFTASDDDKNDYIDGGAGDDTLFGEGGDDTIIGGDGSDIVFGGDGNDDIDTSSTNAFPLPDLGFPTNPLFPAVAADSDPFDDRDFVDGGDGNDTISTGDDEDTILGGDGDDIIDAGIDADTIYGGDGKDTIIGGEGSDYIEGGDGDDTIYGGLGPSFPDAINITDDGSDGSPVGPDPVTNNGMDVIYGGEGNDTIFGADDDDIIYGGTGNDTIDAGIDDDYVEGGAGNDIITGGQGNDTLLGQAGSDTFTDATGGDTVDGGTDDGVDENGDATTDFDTLDLTGLNYEFISQTIDADGDSTSGQIRDLDNGGIITFSEIEEILGDPICFTLGTLIATPNGQKTVESLKEGDKIITRDNGIQEIRWGGSRTLNGPELRKTPHLRPILIKAGSLGENQPERDMMVSPQHRMLVSNEQTSLYFDEHEVLVAAKHLVNHGGVQWVDTLRTTYIHFLFDKHEIVLANGAWTESFQPGDYSLDGLGNSQRSEIYDLFPELQKTESRDSYQAARRSLKRHEARLLTK
jgi:Ca2+-binding RTX toxin-like protein